MHQGHLTKAAVELAKDWRSDRALRKLEALLAVADETASLIITGNGDVVQPENDLIAIGSGGAYAQAAATALLENTELDAREIAEKALNIAVIFVCLPTTTTPSKSSRSQQNCRISAKLNSPTDCKE